jgi:hypothetical protein
MALTSFCRKSDEHTEDGKYGNLHALLLGKPFTFSDKPSVDVQVVFSNLP